MVSSSTWEMVRMGEKGIVGLSGSVGKGRFGMVVLLLWWWS
jgi:hypothetical protein